MYKVEFLPSARRDMIEIMRYCCEELENSAFADMLATEFIEAAETTGDMPYKNPMYVPIRPLKHEYRTILVRNYLMFYWVDENSQTVVFARVIHARRNYERFLS